MHKRRHKIIENDKTPIIYKLSRKYSVKNVFKNLLKYNTCFTSYKSEENSRAKKRNNNSNSRDQ